MIAVCSGLETGIDVEYMHRDINVREIAKRFFLKRKLKKSTPCLRV